MKCFIYGTADLKSKQIYYTRVRVQIINHMNSSLDNYLVNGQMARNKVRVKGSIKSVN